MLMTKTSSEPFTLRAEAERRVRAGQSRSDVASELNIPPSTLALWALRGGWRSKDLRAERAKLVADIAVRVTRQSCKPDIEPVEIKSADPRLGRASAKTTEARAGSARPLPERVSLSIARVLMEQGLLEEAERAARFSLRYMDAAERVEARELKRQKPVVEGLEGLEGLQGLTREDVAEFPEAMRTFTDTLRQAMVEINDIDHIGDGDSSDLEPAGMQTTERPFRATPVEPSGDDDDDDDANRRDW
jgi:hypothetical protein